MIVHASCVALSGKAVLILGPSGSGKSALALSLMAMGAGLVADDQTVLRREGASLVADAPEAIRGQIEARGVGILAADAVGPVPISLVVDLGRDEDRRLPPKRTHMLMDVSLPLVLGPYRFHLAPAIRQYLEKGRTF